MRYKISNDFIAKVSAPVVCRIADQEFEFENGAACAKAEFDKLYVPANISVDDNKMVVTLEEKSMDSKMPSLNANEEWVEQYKEDFGTEPSFF